MCFCTNSCHTERTRTPSFLLTHSLSTTIWSERTTTTVFYNFLYWIRTVNTLDLTDIKSKHNGVSKYSHKPLYSLGNTSQSNNSHTVNQYKIPTVPIQVQSVSPWIGLRYGRHSDRLVPLYSLSSSNTCIPAQHRESELVANCLNHLRLPPESARVVC